MTPDELERRRTVVGASEVGLLFGLPAFGGRTLSDLWYEKKFGVEVESNGNASTKLGTRLESTVLDAAEEYLGEPIIHRQQWLSKGINGATLDGWAERSDAVVEAKTSGIIGPSTAGQWGDELTDEVPESYLVQVQAQLLVTGSELAWLAALIGGRGFAMFRIKPQAELQRLIVQRSEEFIASLQRECPGHEPPQLDTLKRLRRQPNKIVELDEALFMNFDLAKKESAAADKHKEDAQRHILAAFGDAEAARVPGGILTYYQQNRADYSVPDSTYRVLRFKKD